MNELIYICFTQTTKQTFKPDSLMIIEKYFTMRYCITADFEWFLTFFETQ
jgi:hypothetical protein